MIGTSGYLSGLFNKWLRSCDAKNIVEYLNGNMNDDDIDFINIFVVLFVNRLMHDTKKGSKRFIRRATCLWCCDKTK